MARKLIAFASSFVSGLLLCAAFGSPLALGAEPVVRMAEFPGSIAELVPWAMVGKGFCKNNGITCQPVYLTNGPLTLQAVAAGSVDFIYTSLDLTMEANAKGAGLQVIGVGERNDPYVLVMRSGVAQPHHADGYPKNMLDLKGRVVGVAARGSATELFVDALLQGARMKPSDVTFVGVGAPNTAFAAIEAKRVDAVMSWAPIEELCRVTKKCDIQVNLRDGRLGPANIRALDGGFGVWQARREYIRGHSAQVKAFSRALVEATQWVKDPKNHAAVMALAEAHLKIGNVPHRARFLQEMVDDEIAQFGTHFDRSVVHAFDDFLIAHHRLKKPFSVKEIVWPGTP